MSKASRDKGKRGELEVVHVFRDAGLQADRTAALQAGSVEGVGDVTVQTAYGDVAVEVKRTETYSLPAWQRQADASGAVAIAYRRSGTPKTPEPWRAVVRLDFLASLMAELTRLRAAEQKHRAEAIEAEYARERGR